MVKFNDKGYTLVLVLLVITLISIFGTVVTSQVLSSTKQVKQTEGMQKATDVAEMGIDDFYKDLKTSIVDLNLSNNTCSKLISEASELNLIPTTQIDTNTKYTISIDPVPCEYNNTEKKFIFSFHSTGEITQNGVTNTKKLTAIFPINIGNLFPEVPESYSTCGIGGAPACLPSSDDTNWEEPVYFPNVLKLTNKDRFEIDAVGIYANGLEIDGINNIDELNITGDLFINGGSLFHNHANVTVGGNYYLSGDFDDRNHGDLIINGDAYFYKSIITKPNSFICVDGTLFKPQNSNYTVDPLPYDSCQEFINNTKDNILTGIYAKNEDDLFSIDNITINDNNLEIQY